MSEAFDDVPKVQALLEATRRTLLSERLAGIYTFPSEMHGELKKCEDGMKKLNFKQDAILNCRRAKGVFAVFAFV